MSGNVSYLVPASLLRAVLRGQAELEPVDLVTFLLMQALPGGPRHETSKLAQVLGPRGVDAWRSAMRLREARFLDIPEPDILLVPARIFPERSPADGVEAASGAGVKAPS